MVDKLGGPLALGFAHGFKNARLGHSAQIGVDRRLPARRHHVEAGRAGQHVRVDQTLAQAMSRDARAAVAVSLLVEGVDPERGAVGEQSRLVFTSEPDQRLPQSVFRLR